MSAATSRSPSSTASRGAASRGLAAGRASVAGARVRSSAVVRGNGTAVTRNPYQGARTGAAEDSTLSAHCHPFLRLRYGTQADATRRPHRRPCFPLPPCRTGYPRLRPPLVGLDRGRRRPEVSGRRLPGGRVGPGLSPRTDVLHLVGTAVGAREPHVWDAPPLREPDLLAVLRGGRRDLGGDAPAAQRGGHPVAR